MSNMAQLRRKLKDAAKFRHIGKGRIEIISEELMLSRARAKSSDVLKHYVGLRRLWMDNYKFVIPIDFAGLLTRKINK